MDRSINYILAMFIVILPDICLAEKTCMPVSAALKNIKALHGKEVCVRGVMITELEHFAIYEDQASLAKNDYKKAIWYLPYDKRTKSELKTLNEKEFFDLIMKYKKFDKQNINAYGVIDANMPGHLGLVRDTLKVNKVELVK